MLGGSALVYVASALALNVVQSRSYLVRWVRESSAGRARVSGG